MFYSFYLSILFEYIGFLIFSLGCKILFEKAPNGWKEIEGDPIYALNDWISWFCEGLNGEYKNVYIQ
jgi:hypothetical protein